MTDAAWAICSLSALCCILVALMVWERVQHQRERTESNAQANERERGLLNRIMSRDYHDFAVHEPIERREPQMSTEQREALEAQQAVDWAGTIQ